MEDVVARKPAARHRQLEVLEAHHACTLCGIVRRWPSEPWDLIDGLREQSPTLIQHLLDFPGGSLRAQQKHLQALGQLRHLGHEIRRQQVPQRRIQMSLAEDRGALADAGHCFWLTSHDLELYPLVGEEVICLVFPVWICYQERLQVIAEELILIGTWKRIQKRKNVHLLEFGGRVPVREDLRVGRDQPKTCWLCGLYLQANLAHLDHLAHVEQPHSFGTRAIWRVLTFEVGPDILIKQLLRGQLRRAPGTELDLLKADHW
mmetsp:Transcript_105136/g.250309  ORF Transcript_105136/g.250309 Transcript_105136/m.250309 type:complete len:261 (+) Transcript_105136:169-951(+)